MRAAEEGLLLLCCRLGQEVQPLTATEYQQLSALLQAAFPQPPQENVQITEVLLAGLSLPPDYCKRILTLLDREEQLPRYLTAEFSVLTRISEGFPQRLRRLGKHCPPVLFCKGDASLLNGRCVSLVGSRQLSSGGKTFARRIGALAAKEGITLVSGGAVGADYEAQESCLAAGGRVICFVPDELQRHPARKNLLYCSDEGYEFAFSSARALRRNRYIHALGEKVFVAQCPHCSGGTWAGTSENLREGYSNVYHRNDGSEGMRALQALGAVPVSDFLPSIDKVQPFQLSIFD